MAGSRANPAVSFGSQYAQPGNVPHRETLYPQGHGAQMHGAVPEPMSGWGPANMDDDLANNMAGLNMNYQAAGHSNRSAQANIKRMASLGNNLVEPLYQGWKFDIRQERIDGKTRINVKQASMKKDQKELKKKAKNMGMISLTTQLSSISGPVRHQVNKLFEELNEMDPRFEWNCVYAKLSDWKLEVIAKRNLRITTKPKETKIGLGAEAANLNNINQQVPSVDPSSFEKGAGHGPLPNNVDSQPVQPQFRQQTPANPAHNPQTWNNTTPTGPMPEQDRARFGGDPASMMAPYRDAGDQRGVPGTGMPSNQPQYPAQVPNNHGKAHHSHKNQVQKPEPIMKDYYPAPRAQGGHPNMPPPKVHQPETRQFKTFDRICTPEPFSDSSTMTEDESLFEETDSDSVTTASTHYEDAYAQEKDPRPGAKEYKYRVHERKRSQKYPERTATTYPARNANVLQSRNSHSRRGLGGNHGEKPRLGYYGPPVVIQNDHPDQSLTNAISQNLENLTYNVHDHGRAIYLQQRLLDQVINQRQYIQPVDYCALLGRAHRPYPNHGLPIHAPCCGHHHAEFSPCLY